MKPKGSLPSFYEPATCTYPEPDQSSPYPTITSSRRSILTLSSHIRLSLPSVLPSGFLTKTWYAPLLASLRATYPAHLGLLDFITQIIFGEQYRAKSFCYVVFSTPLLRRSS
jgi:hypothetical protein